MGWFKFLKSGLRLAARPNADPDPEEINVENAYKTRWVWYHTILALELFMTNLLLFIIVVQLANI
jgi:hypothetical protein